MRRAWLFVLAAACHKSPPTGSDADALWDLAPTGAELGIVATPNAMQMLSRALDTARTLAAMPDFAPVKPMFDSVVSGLLGKPDATLADAGLSTTRGFAVFVTKDGVIGAIPVADRDKFVALKHGRAGSNGSGDSINGTTCKPLRGYYICATTEAMFGRLGTGSLRGKVALAGGRGDIELYAPGLDLMLGTGDLAAVAKLSPGQLEVSARWAGTPTGTAAQYGSGAAPKVDLTGASGFASVDLAPALRDLPAAPIVAGLTAEQLGKALKGTIVATVPGGTTDLRVRIALADPAPIQTLLDHCDELPLDPRPTTQNGTCRLSLPALSQLDLDAWIENGELRIGAHKGPAPAGQPTAPTAFGRQLAAGDWTLVFWGRGTMLSTQGVTPYTGDVPPETAMSMHLMDLVSEIGFGAKIDGTGLRASALVRTIYTSPQADQLAAIDGATTLHGGSAAAALATPGTPFAADYAAGQGGLMIPAALVGLGAGVIVPMLGSFISPEAGPPGTDSSDPGSASPPP